MGQCLRKSATNEALSIFKEDLIIAASKARSLGELYDKASGFLKATSSNVKKITLFKLPKQRNSDSEKESEHNNYGAKNM